jgi:transcriptional regulator with XRE-family HTH domain
MMTTSRLDFVGLWLQRLAEDQVPGRLLAVERLEALGRQVGADESGARRRIESALWSHLRKEADPGIREAIGGALFDSLCWDIQYGAVHERRRAAVRCPVIAASQIDGSLLGRLEAILSTCCEKEWRPDIRRLVRSALVAVKARKLGRRRRPRPSRLVMMGAVLRGLRRRAGLSRKEIADRAGTHSVSIGYAESGAREAAPNRYLRIFDALGEQVQLEDTAAFYAQWNPEVSSLPWYQKASMVYETRLPDGMTLDAAVATPPDEYLQRKLVELGVSQSQLAHSLGLTNRRVWDLIHGRSSPPSLSFIQRIAERLEIDPSFLYLLFHREIPSFLRVAIPGTGGQYCLSDANRFREPCSKPRNAPAAAPNDVAVVLRLLGLNVRGRYASAIAKHVRFDAQRNELYIVLPSEMDPAHVDRWDLLEELQRSLEQGGASRSSFFRGRRISRNAFFSIANGSAIPSERSLAVLATTLGKSEESLLYWSLTRTKPRGLVVARRAQ